MSRDGTPTAWSFLTNHAGVLLCIAQDPGARLRDIGEAVGITERAAHRIVGELTDAGYVSRRRVGRRNRYTIQAQLPIPDPLARGQRVGDLIAVLAGPDAPGGARRRPSKAPGTSSRPASGGTSPRRSAQRQMFTPPTSSRGDASSKGAGQVAR